MFLQNLEAERVVYSIPANAGFSKIPIQYLLSQLFLNFRPMWDPVLKLIESHAVLMAPADFWSVYLPFLHRVRLEQVEEIKDPSTEVDYLNLVVSPERLDFINVRCLLWQGLARYGPVVEKQHPLIVPLFLDFWQNEYSAADGTVAKSQNLLVASPDETCELEGEEKTLDRKKLIQLLAHHLAVFASFKRPRYITREAEVTPILYRLLAHRSSDVQKHALDCLCAYGFAYLTPYKENLYRLLDEKTFRSELTLFSIDVASSPVRPEHRSGFTPVLMRLLFGKMQTKTGHNSAGKQSIQHRQALVLRYLAGFSDSEIDVFLDLSFQMFHNYQKDDDVCERIVQVMKDADPSVAHPLKRLQGALVMMGTIFAKLGNLMKSTLPKLLKILLCICAHVTALIDKRTTLDAKFLTQLKNLRTLCMERVALFFTKFERYPWSASEVEALFHACIWPQLELLPIEAIHTPTPLLKLFQVWSQNPR